MPAGWQHRAAASRVAQHDAGHIGVRGWRNDVAAVAAVDDHPPRHEVAAAADVGKVADGVAGGAC